MQLHYDDASSRDVEAPMRLSRYDLQQMDEAWLESLSSESLLEVSKRLLSEAKALHDQLSQNPTNSSRPPSTRAPWEKAARETGMEEAEESAATPIDSDMDESAAGGAPLESSAAVEDEPGAKASPEAEPPRRAGKQAGSPGMGARRSWCRAPPVSIVPRTVRPAARRSRR